jgi:hypothetical protein
MNRVIGNKPPCCLPEKYVFFEPLYNNTYGTYRTRSVAATGVMNASFQVPEDFNKLIELFIEYVAVTGLVDADIDLASNYAKTGENYQQHVETDTLSTYTCPSNIWCEMDLTPVFSDIEAGDHCGIQINQSIVGSTVHYKHIVMRYK